LEATLLSVGVEPADGLIDVVPSISVEGVPKGAEVLLTVRTVDADGSQWRSSGTYPVGEGGRLELGDPEQPWWSMQFDDPTRSPVAFSPPDTFLDYEVEVRAETEVTSTPVRRRWATGASAEEISGDGWRLLVYRPPHAPALAPAVLLIPGSTGPGTPSAVAALLASHGYVAAVLVYLGEPGMVKTLRRVPVETFHAAARRLGELPEVDADRLALYAVSVGVMGAAYAFSVPEAPAIRALVLLAGSHVIWQALVEGPPPKEPAFTYGGEDLPYVPIRGERLLGQVARNAIMSRFSRRPRSRALKLFPAYAAGLKDQAAVEAAAIPVEQIKCPIATISGGQDAMWPASEMARVLHDRRRRYDRDGHDVIVDYPEAGHFLRPPICPTTVNRTKDLVAGGIAQGWARAQRDAWATTLAFLESALTLDAD
jgi:dienelactone hydrolase